MEELRVEAQTGADDIYFTTGVADGDVFLSGATVLLYLYKKAGDTVTLNGVTMSEVSGKSAYKYGPWTAPGVNTSYYGHITVNGVLLRDVVVEVSGGTIYTASPTPGSGLLFSNVDDIVDRLQVNLAAMSIQSTAGSAVNLAITDTEALLAINEAGEIMQSGLEILKDDFAYDVTQNVPDIWLDDGRIPYPYRVDCVRYGSTNYSPELSFERNRSICDADITASNTSIYRYATFHDTFKHYIRLNGLPAAGIGSGCKVYGPYMPDRATAGGVMNFEVKYDELILAIAAYLVVRVYKEEAPQLIDNAERTVAKSFAQFGAEIPDSLYARPAQISVNAGGGQ